jgi:hypothetical protein
MDITIHLPDAIGHELENLPNKDEFVLGVVKRGLKERWLDEQTAISIKQADKGEFADEKDVKAFFDKWSNNAG